MYSATERLFFGEILRFTHNDTGFYSVCHRLAMTNIRTSSRFFSVYATGFHKLVIFLRDTPCKCCSECEKVSNFVVAKGASPKRTYFDESVLAFYPCTEIWTISLSRGRQSHSSPCIAVSRHLFWRHYCPIPDTGVGYCLFVIRHSRASVQIN